jgi:hypothetical protein
MHARPLAFLLVLLVATASGVAAQDVGAAPNFGDLRLDEGFLPDPETVAVKTGTEIEVDVGSCSYGYVSEAPDVDLYYTTSGDTPLYIYVEGDGDTMLLVNTPSGDWECNDDGHGNLNPILSFPDAENGLYDIWVGSYGQETQTATLYVSEINPDGGDSSRESGAPDFTLDPMYGDVNLDAGFLPDPHVIELRAGGGLEVDVGSCNYGYVANGPDVDLYYEANNSAQLYIYVESDDDTTLLINRPDGSWICDDDGHEGLNPLIHFEKPASGLYDIWVGTYGDDLTDATLYISEIDPS